eukprot:5340100-Prymnesium_polylepis.1
MYMVPKRFDLFAFFEYPSYWSSNPGSFKMEEKRRALKLSIGSAFLAPAGPTTAASPPAGKKKKTKRGGAGAGAGDGTQGTDAAKPTKEPKAAPTAEDADSFLLEKIEQIKIACDRRGCSKRIQELERRLKNGKDDSWFQPFWKHGCTNRH